MLTESEYRVIKQAYYPFGTDLNWDPIAEFDVINRTIAPVREVRFGTVVFTLRGSLESLEMRDSFLVTHINFKTSQGRRSANRDNFKRGVFQITIDNLVVASFDSSGITRMCNARPFRIPKELLLAGSKVLMIYVIFPELMRVSKKPMKVRLILRGYLLHNSEVRR